MGKYKLGLDFDISLALPIKLSDFSVSWLAFFIHRFGLVRLAHYILPYLAAPLL